MKNNKSIKGIILVSVFLICIFSFQVIKCSAYTNNEGKENNKKIILIDPGHGGLDGGAVSKNGTSEKGINLEISKNLKKCLEEKGYKVEMTREEDKGLYSNKGRVRDKKNEDLSNRCKMKVSTKCDLFISIHLNMFTQSKYYGAQVWYSKEGESAEIAHIVQQNLIKDLDKSNHRQEKCAKGAYKILRCNDHIPSILVECGFLSNPEEEKKLKDSNYQKKIANSIANSVEEFYRQKH